MKLKYAIAFVLLSACAYAQYAAYQRSSIYAKATINFTALPTTNSNASNGWTPTRKQLGNCATGWNGTQLLPTTAPVGQLYCTSAIRTAAIAAGGPANGFVAATASGTGIASVTNGFNAGGVDSPVTLVDTYAATSTDTFCTGDTVYAALVGTVFHDVAMPACNSSSSAFFSESTATSHGNSDVLFPTDYQSTGLDTALYTMVVFHFRPNAVSTLWDLETDYNYNTASTHSYVGHGIHWNNGHSMWETCPQGCTGWKTMKWTPVAGGSPVTTYPLTTNHIYGFAIWLSRTATCDWTSLVNCYFYDYITVWDVTAGTTPVLYSITDSTGAKLGGIPKHQPTYPTGLITPQVQVDMTAGNTSTSVDFDSYTVVVYSK